MTLEGWSGPMDDWVGQTVGERLHFCRRMLWLHGIISEAEHERVKKRLAKAEGVLRGHARALREPLGPAGEREPA